MDNNAAVKSVLQSSLAYRAARITVYIIALLALLKLVVGIGIGSIAIISEGIHTSVDLAAGLIAFLSIRTALKPPDKDHPYGHGKYENLMGLVQAGFIIAPSVFIIYNAVHHLVSHYDVPFNKGFGGLEVGIWVMVITVLVNLLLGLWLRRVYALTKSEAIRANAYHQFTDLYTSIGVVVALVIIMITGNRIYDPIVAILVASYSIYLGWVLMARSADSLLDREAEPEVQKKITKALMSENPDIRDFHKLRTRRSGQTVFGDIHVTFCRYTNVEKAHGLMDRMEEEIENKVGNVDITMHAEACTTECGECPSPGALLKDTVDTDVGD